MSQQSNIFGCQFCGSSLNKNNRSGYCHKHRKKSPEFKKRRLEKDRATRLLNPGAFNRWYRENREDFLARTNRLNQESMDRKYRASIRYATRRGKSWNIAFEDYSILLSKPCTYCGESLERKTAGGLDRIDNSQGYSPENVLPCCWNCNLIRSNRLTVIETQAVIAMLQTLRGKKHVWEK